MAKKPESLLDFDITKFDVSKLIGDFKVPGIDVDTIVASQRKNIEALTQANKLAFEGVQAVFKRQAEIFRQVIEEGATVAKDAFERALSNARELSEIIAKSNSEAFELLNKRFTQVLDEIKDGLAKTK